MSIPAEPSLFQYEIHVFNSEPCKWLNGPDGGSVLWFNIADLSDHRALDLRNLGLKFGPIPKAKKYVFFPNSR